MHNTHLSTFAAIAFAWALAALPANTLGRIWTDRSGKFTVEAELVTVKNGSAYLEHATAGIKKVPLERLSVEDLRHLATLPKFRDQVANLLPTEKEETPRRPQQRMVVIKSHLESGSVRQFRSPSWGYEGLAFSNDGGHLVTLGSDNVTVFDLAKSEVAVNAVDRQAGSTECLALSPDGKRLLAGNRDGEVLTWRFNRGKLTPENRFAIHEDAVVSIAVSPDGQRAISTHKDEVACLWDVQSGKVLASYTDFDFGSNAAVLFSRHGGQGLFTDGEFAALLNVKSTDLMQVMKLCDYAISVHSSDISSDGTRIAACEGQGINVWETRTGKRLPEIATDDIQWSAKFTIDGGHLVTGGSGVVSVWDLENGSLSHEFKLQDSGYVQHVAVSPDGIHIAAIGGPIGQLVEVLRLPPDLAK